MTQPDNSIGNWRPGWGPMPVKVTNTKMKPRKPQKAWYRITCWSCEIRPSFFVHGAENLQSSYECKFCGLPMSVATCNSRKSAATVPARKQTGKFG